MATTSPDNLRTPDPGSPYNLVSDLATLAGDVQSALGNRANAYKGTTTQRTSFTSTAVPGALWQDTDGIRMLWKRGASAWEPAVWRWAGTSTQMNAFAAPDGFEWFNTTDQAEYLRVGAAWEKRLRTETLSLIRGAAASGYVGPSVTVANGVATFVGRVNNGSGLTLSGSFQQVATLPTWARPSGTIIAPATATGTTVNALVQVTSDGQILVASSGNAVTFAFSYPI